MRRALPVLLPLAAVFVLALWRSEGPPPRDANAPANAFSAIRAKNTLRAVLMDGVPHPVGTRANMRVRSRIQTQFRALGYDVTLQRRFACNAAAMCAVVENVIATPPGNAQGDIVLLTAHYDSVGAGGGASDDGMGIAALLEIARAIRNEQFRNRVMFLIDDGEEAGLLGAEAFAADEARMRDVAAIINIEMRGTHGASNMFETSRGNRWLIRHLASSVERPMATSLFYTIYNLLPNDTDVTIFKRAGKPSVNFAAIRGVNWYHTPFDDLVRMSPRTLQHHGDNVLALLRALANADLAARSNTDATYFDVLNFHLVWWPQEWTVWIAVVSLILLLIGARRVPPRVMTFGVLATFAAILLAALGGAGVAWLIRFGTDGVRFHATQWPSIAAMWLIGFAAAAFALALFHRKKDPEALLYGVAIVWHMIGIALALTLPGAAYLFIVPAVAVAICALIDAEAKTTSAIAATIAAILMFPLGLLLYEALGSGLMSVVAVILGIFSTLVTPLFARPRHGVYATVAALVCAVIASVLPEYTPQKPRPLPIAYVDDVAAREPQWIVGDLTDTLRRAAQFKPADTSLTPWNRGAAWAASAPRTNQPRVVLTAQRSGNRVRVTVRSSRNAGRLVLLSQGDAKVLTVNGVPLPPRPARFRDRMPEGMQYASASGVQEMTVELEARRPLQLIASDLTFGLPTAGMSLRRARNMSPGTTIQDGDVTITRVRGSA